MAKQSLRTFKDIQDAVMESLKIQSSDAESRRRVKRNINTILLDEVIPYKRWQWLRKTRTLQTEPYFAAGTASVEQNTVEVTLTQSPGTSLKGHNFVVTHEGESYRIQAHTAGSNLLILETPYNGATNLATAYKVWTDSVPLPSDCKEVVEVKPSPDYLGRPLQAMGLQELRRLQSAAGSNASGRPSQYSVGPFREPDEYSDIPGLAAPTLYASNGLVKTLPFYQDLTGLIFPGDQIEVQGSTEYTINGQWVVSSVNGGALTFTGLVPFNTNGTSIGMNVTVRRKDAQVAVASFRDLIIYPAISLKRTSLTVDYQVNVEELEDDADEPPMPVEDRIVLYYGAMWLSASRERNTEWAQENLALMQAKLARMAGKTEDTPERPVMKMSPQYLSTKRRGWGRRGFGAYAGTAEGWTSPVGGGGNVNSGTPNTVAIFNEYGELVGSSEIDLTALEFLLGAQGGLSANIPAGSTGYVVNEWSATQYKGVQVSYQVQRDGVFECGMIYIATNGSQIDISSPVGVIGQNGVTFDADLFAGNIRLLANTDSSLGPSILTYRTLLF